MQLEFFQIDAFATKPFEGNPAAVFPLQAWLPDATLQSIAEEHNLSETVFFVKTTDGYHIRWFTPAAEVDLCGHATLASAFALFQILEPERTSVTFASKSGPLSVHRNGTLMTLDFPAESLVTCPVPEALRTGLGVEPEEVLKCDDYFAVLGSETALRSLAPNHAALAALDCRGICVTAPGDHVDFVSRFFAPRLGIKEDPVTGSSHCALTPYWAGKLGKAKLSARQLSPRGGNLECELHGDRVEISGTAALYLRGTVYIEDPA